MATKVSRAKKKVMPKTPKASSDLVDQRVKHIEEMMRTARWERGRSNRELAAAWAVTVASVNAYAAEASRRVRAEVTDPDSVQVTICGALHTIVRDGLAEADRTAVIRAADVWSRVSGARAPDKLDVAEVDPLHGLNLAEKSAWCRERAEQLLEMANDFDQRARTEKNSTVDDYEECG